jgi:hypothetical protein
VFVQLATRFSKTPPEALPGYYSQVGETILLTNNPFTEYWIGAVNAICGEYLGDTTLVIFDISDKPMPKTTTGRKILDARISRNVSIKPFDTQAELFLHGNQGAHDLVQRATRMLPEYKTWESLFVTMAGIEHRAPDEEALLELGLRFANTKPATIPVWVQNKPMSSDIALSWVGAQKVFGSLWHTTIQDVKVPNVSFDSGSSAPSYAPAGQIAKPVHAGTRPLQSSVAPDPFQSSVKAPKYPPLKPKASPILVNDTHAEQASISPKSKSIADFFKPRSRPQPKQKKKSGKQTKFKTYLKLDLDISVTSKDDYDSVQKEVFRVLHGIWAALISTDSRDTYILSWHERDANKCPVIKQGDTPPSNRFGVKQKYVENWGIGWFADSMQIRFHIGHEKDLNKYLSSSKVCNLVEESMGLFYKDKLQTSETVSAVWMGGPIPDEATQELIEETILASSIFTSNGVTNLKLQVFPDQKRVTS